MIDHEQYRFGSARWAEYSEIANAGLLNGSGVQVGYLNNRPITLDTDAPMITIAGAGSGKMRDLLAMAVSKNAHKRNFILDPRGEIASVTMPSFAFAKAKVFCWNPFGVVGLPQHSINPLDILDWDSPLFHTTCKFIADDLIETSGSANGRYFELRAREWLENLIKALVEREREISYPKLFRVINMIEGDSEGWANFLEFMLNSSLESVRRTASEMLTKQQDSEKEFGSIIGEIYAHVTRLDDPKVLTSLERSDVSLKDMCEGEEPMTIYLVVPAEFLGLLAPVIRNMISVQVQYKSRSPAARPIYMIVDEAGQLGNFEALLRAFTYGRGAGVRVWALFQDVGQIVKNYGAPTLQSFMGSAAKRQFFGVRDFHTAQMVSEMLGHQTLEYDDTLAQAAARKQKMTSAMGMLSGSDPFEAFAEYRYQTLAATNRTKQTRALMSPDEVLAMPEDKQILFISGQNLYPVLADKRPYFTRREFVGRFLPNPYHPPTDSMVIPQFFGGRRVRVISENPTYPYSDLPQYWDRPFKYIEGFRP